jgi:hypothetical protein
MGGSLLVQIKRKACIPMAGTGVLHSKASLSVMEVKYERRIFATLSKRPLAECASSRLAGKKQRQRLRILCGSLPCPASWLLNARKTATGDQESASQSRGLVSAKSVISRTRPSSPSRTVASISVMRSGAVTGDVAPNSLLMIRCSVRLNLTSGSEFRHTIASATNPVEVSTWLSIARRSYPRFLGDPKHPD